jgi:hypothetical protein
MAEYITYGLNLISNGLQQTIDGDMEVEYEKEACFISYYML